MFNNLRTRTEREEEYKDMDLKSSKRGFHRSPGTSSSVVKGNESRLVRCVHCGFPCDRERDSRAPEESWAFLGTQLGSQLTASSAVSDTLSPTYARYMMFFNYNTLQAARVITNTGNDIYDSSVINAPFTFEAWVYGDSNGRSTLGTICNKGHGISNSQKGYQIHVFSGNATNMKVGMNVAHGSGSDADRATFADSTANGQFIRKKLNHVVLVYNELGDKKITAYINGASIAGTLTAGTGNVIDDTLNPLYIGNKLDGSVTWDGYIGDVRVYHNRALSATEVLSNYNLSITSGATSYWPFQEGIGPLTIDTVGRYELDFGTIASSVFVPATASNPPIWKLLSGNSKSPDKYYERTVNGGCPSCGSFLYDKKPMEVNSP